MASVNLDLVRSIYAPWERGDFSSAEWADPEIELVFAEGPQRGSWKGLAAAGEAWSDFLRSWEDWRVVVEEYRELDDERVLVLLHNSGRGRRSGVEAAQITAKVANVLHVRAGKVTRFVLYADRERALADLGLASEARSTSS
jgi:ketosteroid isomerase-like protein